MPEDPKPQSWWHTLPGVLTALAAVLTATTGLIVALRGDTPPAPGGTEAASPSSHVAPAASQPVSAAPVAAPPAASPQQAAPRTVEAEAGPVPAAGIDISGLWMSEEGEPTRISQQGNHIEFVSDGISCMSTPSRMQGRGSLDGYRLEVRYNSTLPSTGQCSGMLTPDGRSLVSNCRDSVCGTFVSTLYRR